MSRAEQHLDLLAVSHYVLGALAALFSCAFLVPAATGVAILAGSREAEGPPPRILGWILVIAGTLLIAGGGTLAGFIIAAGRRLSRRAARTFCIAVAAAECAFLPLGTILGILTIAILLRDPAKALFGVERR
jgi:hypothetical protein